MTYSSSHLGISTIVLFILAPKKLREELKSNPRFLFVISLAAIAPDFDLIISNLIQILPDFWIFIPIQEYFVGAHRVWSHSLFFPFLLIILAPQISKIFKNKPNLTRNIQLFGFIWFTHIIFDLTFGPIALFYPLDTRFYDVSFGIKVGLSGNWLIPVTLTGFFMDVSFAPQNVGTSTFFVNWTPEERISTFGSEELLISVTNFWTHVVLFMYYFFVVLVPYLRFEIKNIYHWLARYESEDTSVLRKISNRLAIGMLSSYGFLQKVGNKGQKFKQYNRRWIINSSLLILIIFSFLGGPYYGSSWDQEQRQGETFWILSDGIKLSSFKAIDVGESTNFSLNVIHDPGVIEIDVFSFITTETIRNQFLEYYRDLLDLFDDDNISYTQFHSGYRLLMNSFVPLESVRSINSQNGTKWEFSSNSDLIVFSGIYSWNISDYFIKGFTFDLRWTFSRNNEVRNGISLMLFFSTLLVLSIITPKLKGKNL